MRSRWTWAFLDLLLQALLYGLAVFLVGVLLATGLGVCA